MENYPSNSKTVRSNKVEKKTVQSKREDSKPEIEKVVQGEVTRRKKPLGKRFAETFVVSDAQSVWSYVISQVIVPAGKDMITDAVSQGVERLIFGEGRPTRGSHTSRLVRSAGSNIAYNRYSSSRTERATPSLSRQARASHNFDEIILASRIEGEEVLDRLHSLISQYGQATVNDLYEMIGITGDYTDEKWGWDSLPGARVVRTRGGGYLLDLPKPIPVT